jgi:hypothetical protein
MCERTRLLSTVLLPTLKCTKGHNMNSVHRRMSVVALCSVSVAGTYGCRKLVECFGRMSQKRACHLLSPSTSLSVHVLLARTAVADRESVSVVMRAVSTYQAS